MFDLFDIVSPPITLFYRSKSQHTSIPGLLISIISMVFLTVVSIIISLDFFFKRNPNAYTYKKKFMIIGFMINAMVKMMPKKHINT